MLISTERQIAAFRKTNGGSCQFQGRVGVPLDDLLEMDYEEFLDHLGEALVGTSLLQQIEYSLAASNRGGDVCVNVSGVLDLSDAVEAVQDAFDLGEAE